MKKIRRAKIPGALSLVFISLLWLPGCDGSSSGGGTSPGDYQLLDVHGAGAQRSEGLQP